ncbi:ATP-dependent RNA helicase DBP10 [Fusarium oxysporum f. sp. albedinis]|nr:ATP-dependent RNA helicase DBP10 [Fusarium oxysporum f. sp. albedinis]
MSTFSILTVYAPYQKVCRIHAVSLKDLALILLSVRALHGGIVAPLDLCDLCPYITSSRLRNSCCRQVMLISTL